MAKESTADPKTEIQEIITNGKKKSLNFALMKSKEGVVLKAHVTKPSSTMYRECKAAGGMPAMSTKGILNVSGKLIEMTLEDADVSPNLAKQAKKYFASLGIPCKVVFLLPGGARLGEEDDEEAESDASAKRAPEAKAAPDRAETEDPSPEAQETRVERQEEAAADAGPETVQDPANTLEMLRESLMAEYSEMSAKVDIAKANLMLPANKKIEALASMFNTTIEQDPNKARGVLSLLGKMLEKLPAGAPSEASAATAKPSGNRMSQLEALEKSLDDMLAEFA